MNLLTVENISKHYGIKPIFENISFGVDEADKIGIIGVNGTGKSTLLKIIAGIEDADEGQVICGNHVHIEYLSQNPEFLEDETVFGYMMRGLTGEQRWHRENDARVLLTHLDITDMEEKLSHLSGGQKKRVALAKALLMPSEILILDEPTNHLDNEMAEWLEGYLKNFKGAILMVTHDRYFLDSISNKIMEIDNAGIYMYATNYSGYLTARAERLAMGQASERKREALMKNELKWVMRGARARSTKQKARLERLDELKTYRKIRAEERLSVNSLSSRMGKKTIELEHIYKSYGDKKLIEDFSYIFLRNSRIGFIGKNGAGKSTLLKIITGEILPDAGEVILGQTIKIGYFSQENERLDESKKVIDYIRDVAEYIQTSEGTSTASQMLERFLFTPQMQWERIGKLSGGEKRRLYLLRILMEAPNVLILDEPTNDLDIQTLAVLESYLDMFDGIVITVSHDRYFLDRVVERIFSFEGCGKLKQYEGGFSDYWLAVQQENDNENDSVISPEYRKEENEKKAYENQHARKLKFTYKEKKEFETIDEDIQILEDTITELEKKIGQASTDFIRLNALMAEKEASEQQLEEKMERWVYLNDLAEKIEQENTADK